MRKGYRIAILVCAIVIALGSMASAIGLLKSSAESINNKLNPSTQQEQTVES